MHSILRPQVLKQFMNEKTELLKAHLTYSKPPKQDYRVVEKGTRKPECLDVIARSYAFLS